MKDQEKSDSKNISKDLDDANSLESKNDLCSEYVKFLIEEERNKTVVKDEVKEVYTCIILYNIIFKNNCDYFLFVLILPI